MSEGVMTIAPTLRADCYGTKERDGDE
jgi:hypothetical protein